MKVIDVIKYLNQSYYLVHSMSTPLRCVQGQVLHECKFAHLMHADDNVHLGLASFLLLYTSKTKVLYYEIINDLPKDAEINIYYPLNTDVYIYSSEEVKLIEDATEIMDNMGISPRYSIRYTSRKSSGLMSHWDRF